MCCVIYTFNRFVAFLCNCLVRVIILIRISQLVFCISKLQPFRVIFSLFPISIMVCGVRVRYIVLTAIGQSESLEYPFLLVFSQIKYQTIWNEGAPKQENRVLGSFLGISFLTTHHLNSYQEEQKFLKNCGKWVWQNVRSNVWRQSFSFIAFRPHHFIQEIINYASILSCHSDRIQNTVVNFRINGSAVAEKSGNEHK